MNASKPTSKNRGTLVVQNSITMWNFRGFQTILWLLNRVLNLSTARLNTALFLILDVPHRQNSRGPFLGISQKSHATSGAFVRQSIRRN